MKTKTPKKNTGLPSRPEQLSTELETVLKNDSRTSPPRIDFARRRTNRALNTERVVALLQQEAPRFFAIAEVVGKWVWIQFTEKQPPQVTSVLAELGFHWNNRRQTWQHPCGHDTEGTDGDPREKYPTYFPANAKPA